MELTTALRPEVHMLSMMQKMIVVREHVSLTILVKLAQAIVSLILTVPSHGFAVEITIVRIHYIFQKTSFGLIM